MGEPRPTYSVTGGVMRVAADGPKRPALRYHGSKWLLMLWILSKLPADHDVYVSAFAGSFADILRKPRSLIEVVNDLDGDVMNYFAVLRSRKDELMEQIRLTPFHYGEYQLAQQAADDPLERARRFYVRSYMAIAGPTAQWNTGWRRQKVFSRGRDGRKMMVPASVTFYNTAHFDAITDRLQGVTFEMMPALRLIALYDHPRTLFYLDPPYHPDARSKWATKAYRYEMSVKEHEVLLESLNKLEGMVALSGYRVPLYDDMLKGWQRHDRVARVNSNGTRIESLWLNPAAVEAVERVQRQARQRPQQSLFIEHDYPGILRDEEE